MLNNTNKKQIVVGLLFTFTEHLKLNQMNLSNLSSSKIESFVKFTDERYNRKTNEYETIEHVGIIDALLIDVNFGAYGYACYFEDIRDRVKFIFRCNDTKILTGEDLETLKFA